MHWYFTELIFAQKQSKKRKMYFCETSVVLIRAESAQDAYDKSIAWGDDYLKSGASFEVELLGVARLDEIFDSRIGHGTEITGATFFRKEPWSRKKKLIPPKSKLQAFMFEENAQKPFGEVLKKARGKGFVDRCRSRCKI